KLSIEIRQLRVSESRFWQIIPNSTSDSEHTAFRPLDLLETRSGLAFENISTSGDSVQIIGHVLTESVVKPQIVVLPSSSLKEYLIASDRLGGLLFGGMMGLAVFSAIVSLLNRDKTFFLLSALLITSLRIAGFNYGWDLQWIGWEIPTELVPALKNATLLLHLLLTLALFEEIFSSQLKAASA